MGRQAYRRRVHGPQEVLAVVLGLLQVLLHTRPELHGLLVRDDSLDDLIHFGVAAVHHHHRVHVARLNTTQLSLYVLDRDGI